MDPDPLQSYKSDPDSYQVDGDPDPACHSDTDADPDPSFQNYANQCGSGSIAWKLFLGTVHKLLKTIYWKIYKITTLVGSGSALKSRIRIRIMWKVGSESASIKNLNPDPHQIKIRIRIRIKMIRSYRTMYTFYVSFSFTCLVWRIQNYFILILICNWAGSGFGCAVSLTPNSESGRSWELRFISKMFFFLFKVLDHRGNCRWIGCLRGCRLRSSYSSYSSYRNWRRSRLIQSLLIQSFRSH